MLTNTIKKTILSFFMLSFIVIVMTGCSESASEKELAAFSQSITSFSDYMASMDDKISNLDYSTDTAFNDLLDYLDDINVAFGKLADMQIPEQYASIEKLADEASDYMSQAVSLYHSALEADSFLEEDAAVAYQYYTRAMTRITYIGTILQGKLPEGDNITIYETDVSNELIEKITKD